MTSHLEENLYVWVSKGLCIQMYVVEKLYTNSICSDWDNDNAIFNHPNNTLNDGTADISPYQMWFLTKKPF